MTVVEPAEVRCTPRTDATQTHTGCPNQKITAPEFAPFAPLANRPARGLHEPLSRFSHQI